MAVAFIRDDLLCDISEKELAQLTTKLVIPGEPDALAAVIARSRETYDTYAGRYVVPANRQKWLIACLALREICQRVSVVPPKRQASYDEAMKELRDIRDGKFKDLALAEEPDIPENIVEARGRSGGNTAINTSRFG